MKNKMLYLIYLFIFIFICYCGIESKNIEISDSIDFFTTYFDNFQKYLFVGTMMTIPIIFVNHVDYMKPEIRIRMKNATFEYIWKKNFINALFITIFITLAFITISLICKYASPFSILNINSLIRTLSFVICCYVTCESFYLITQNKFLSIAVVVIFNFTFLIIVLGINFYIAINSLSAETCKIILMIYNSVINIIGIIFLYFKCDSKELLT